MRIAGLASGMDTENMIKDLMRAERIPVDRVYQKKVQAEWTRDAYRDVNSRLLRLRNMAFDLRLQGAYQTRAASSSHESIISAAATGSSQDGTFYLKVNALAETASFQSSVEGGVEAAYAAFLNELPADETASFQIRGSDGEMNEITISKQTSLAGVLAEINQNKNLGINAYYDSYTDQVAFSSKATGENAVIEMGAANDSGIGFLNDVFGLQIDAGAQSRVAARGANAKLEINGLKTEREANTFELNGTAITLNEVSQTEVRIDVKHDVDAVVEKISGFVELYNEIVEELNAAMREEVHRDFPPLTPEQRNEMSDKEIELWEERAKSGLLRSDSLVSGTLSEMRLALGGMVEGAGGFKHLSQVGITTGAWFEHGKLHLDENKLKEALAEDAAGVIELFTRPGDTRAEQGIARRLGEVLDERMNRIASTAGKASVPYDQSYLGRQIREYESRLTDMEERLVRVEQSYWDKFTAMERVLSQLYSQSDWLYQQIMAMQG